MLPQPSKRFFSPQPHDLMATLYPTVVIGLGTTGARIIEGVQQRMYEMYQVNRLPIFEYIVLETDSTQEGRIKPTPAGKNIEFVDLSTGGTKDFDSFSQLLDQWSRRGIEPDWIDGDFADALTAKGQGAGGVRTMGRLILWANMKKGGKVRDTIKEAKDNILGDDAIKKSKNLLGNMSVGHDSVKIATTGDDNKKHAHAVVCGTSTGGTYSGAFIDLGYVCQEVLDIDDKESMYNIMLLPPKEMYGIDNANRFKANAYGALNEAEYYTTMADTERRYDAHLPGFKKNTFNEQGPPYHYSYLISQDYGRKSRRVRSPDALANLASLKLFCDLMGLESERVRRITDHQNNLAEEFNDDKRGFNTFGLAAITHPRYQISEYVACKAGETLCQRWTNEHSYTDRAGQERSVPDPGSLARPARRMWEGNPKRSGRGLLEQKMQQLVSQEASLGGLLMDNVRDDIELLKEDRKEKVLRSFRKPGDTYFGRIQRNVSSVGQEIVDELRRSVYEILDETQSLPYAISYTHALKSAAQEILDFWDSLDIPSDPKGWGEYVSTDLEGRLYAVMNDIRTRLRNLVTTREELAEAMLLDAIDKLKAHLLRPRIEEVCSDLDELVNELGTYREMMLRAKQILAKRQTDIRKEVGDTSLPIGRVWAKGSFGDDVKTVLSGITGQQPSAGDLARAEDAAGADVPFDPNNGSRWLATRLREWHSKDENLYTGREATGIVSSEQVKSTYQQKAIDVIARDLDIDIGDAVNSNPNLVETYFGRGNECHLRYQRDDGRIFGIGDYLISPKGTTDEVLRTVEKSIDVKFDEERKVAILGLDHTILYYREEFIGDPLSTLTNRSELESSFRNSPGSLSDESSKGINSNWTRKRIAYNVPAKRREEDKKKKEELQKDALRDLFAIVGDFFIRWKRGSQKGWVPEGIVSEAEDLPLTIGPGDNGGAPEPKWTVNLPPLPVRTFRILDADGTPRPEAVQGLTEDERAQSVLDAGQSLIRSLGRDGMLDIWERTTRDYLKQRHGEEEAVKRARKYFGSSDADGSKNPGVIASFLNATQTNVSS